MKVLGAQDGKVNSEANNGDPAMKVEYPIIPAIQEAEAGLSVPGEPGQHSDTISKPKTNKKDISSSVGCG